MGRRELGGDVGWGMGWLFSFPFDTRFIFSFVDLVFDGFSGMRWFVSSVVAFILRLSISEGSSVKMLFGLGEDFSSGDLCKEDNVEASSNPGTKKFFFDDSNGFSFGV